MVQVVTEDGGVSVWDLNTRQILNRGKLKSDKLRSVEFHGSKCYALTLAGNCRCYDTLTKEKLRTICLFNQADMKEEGDVLSRISGMSLSSDSKSIHLLNQHKLIVVQNKGKNTGVVEATNQTGLFSCSTGCGNIVLLGTSNGQIIVYKIVRKSAKPNQLKLNQLYVLTHPIETRSRLKQLKLYTAYVDDVYHPILLSSDAGGNLCVWRFGRAAEDIYPLTIIQLVSPPVDLSLNLPPLLAFR